MRDTGLEQSCKFPHPWVAFIVPKGAISTVGEEKVISDLTQLRTVPATKPTYQASCPSGTTGDVTVVWLTNHFVIGFEAGFTGGREFAPGTVTLV